MRNLFTFLLTICAFFGKAQEYPESVYTVSGWAIDGYDPVAYFTQNKATKGAKDFWYEWNGSKWLFASAENRDAFKRAPEKYAPQYGGYCAFGISEGYKAKVDPHKGWTLVDGKLYLNYNLAIKTKWLPEKDKRIKQADEKWKALVQE